MTTEEIRKELFSLQDLKYRDFQSKLIPTADADTVIGVRTPEIRKFAKQLIRESGINNNISKTEPNESKTNKDIKQDNKENCLNMFLNDLPHKYFDENQLHAFIISEIKDYNKCIDEVCKFLPYVNNWATCDQMSPKVFKKHLPELFEKINNWIQSDETYTIRFGVGMLMEHFLDENFDTKYADMVAEIRSEEYYVNMMIAWYFATALAKQYEAIIPYIENRHLEKWTHNKAIQKSIESNRISPEQKEYLRSLKIK